MESIDSSDRLRCRRWSLQCQHHHQLIKILEEIRNNNISAKQLTKCTETLNTSLRFLNCCENLTLGHSDTINVQIDRPISLCTHPLGLRLDFQCKRAFYCSHCFFTVLTIRKGYWGWIWFSNQVFPLDIIWSRCFWIIILFLLIMSQGGFNEHISYRKHDPNKDCFWDILSHREWI